jgi:hypothetical protein
MRGIGRYLDRWSVPEMADAPAKTYLVFPVRIRRNSIGVFVSKRIYLARRALGARHSRLNCIDRRHQCRQLWSFVFHSFYLSFLC